MIGAIQEPGYLEGGDFFAAGQDLAMLGIGLRSNFAACQQLMDQDLLGARRWGQERGVQHVGHASFCFPLPFTNPSPLFPTKPSYYHAFHAAAQVLSSLLLDTTAQVPCLQLLLKFLVPTTTISVLSSHYTPYLPVLNDADCPRRLAVVRDDFDKHQDRMHLDCVFSILGDSCCIMLEDIMGEASPTRRLVDMYARDSATGK